MTKMKLLLSINKEKYLDFFLVYTLFTSVSQTFLQLNLLRILVILLHVGFERGLL